jgi:hypothetical protein
MSNEKATTATKTPPPADPAPVARNRYAVERLTFVHAGGVDLFKSTAVPAILRNGVSTLKAGQVTPTVKVEIHYYPHLAHHRAALIAGASAPEVVMVPAAMCYWTPAAEEG